MAGTDALAGNAVGGTGTTGETIYTPAQWTTDLYNLGAAESQAEVMLAKGVTNYAYKDAPTQQLPGGYTFGGPNKYAGRIAPVGGTQNDIRTLRSALNWIQRLDPNQMQNITNAMYAAGFYHDSNYGKNPTRPTGEGKIFDDQAQYAARQLFDEVAKYNLANPNAQKSMAEILQERINAKVGQSKIDEATKATPGQVYQVTVDDPATLRASVVRTAQAILGRAVSDKETDALVAQMTQAERDPQMAAVAAGQQAQTGPDVVLQQAKVDAEARLQEKIQAQNPDEAGAYAEMNYSRMLSNMLGGGQPGGVS